MSYEELGLAYDKLLSNLNVQKSLIEERMKETLKHLGPKERILAEQKDFSRE